MREISRVVLHVPVVVLRVLVAHLVAKLVVGGMLKGKKIVAVYCTYILLMTELGIYTTAQQD